MKEVVDSSNRRLIRPSLSEVKEQMNQQKRQQQNQQRPKRSVPPDQTHAESFYYLKQMQNRTPMVLVLNDGEELHGTIEWYDRACLKLNRAGAPNLLIYKGSIKYLYKQSERAKRAEGEAKSYDAGATNGSPAA